MTKRTRIFTFVLILLAVAVLCYAFFGRSSSIKTPPVVLPTAAQVTETVGPGIEDEVTADVTPETVQAAIGTLRRAESWSATVIVENYWQGGGSTTQLEVAVSGNSTLICIPDEEKNILVTDGRLYIWYNNEPGIYEGESGNDYDADRWMRSITYEDLLALPVEDISSAGYDEYDGKPCIWAEHYSESFGYRKIYYISVNTGLLTGAVTYDGDMLIYRMSTAAVDTSEPAASLFVPPVSK